MTLLRGIHRERRRAREKAVDPVTVILAVALVLGYLGQLVVGLVTISSYSNPGFVRWSVIGLSLLLAGALSVMLRAFGPIAASRATASVLLTAPISRRGVLGRRFGVLMAGMTAIGVVLGVLAAAVAGTAGWQTYLAAAITGATAAAFMAAGCVVLQPLPRGRWLSVGLAAAGGVVLVAAALSRGGVIGIPRLPAILPAVAGVLLVLSVAAVMPAAIGLNRLRRIDLVAGAELVTAAKAGVSFMDLSLLGGVLTQRRTNRLGSVPFRALPAGRFGALVAADLRRFTRFRGAWALAVCLLAVPYAASLLLPATAVGPAATLCAAAVATAAATGLRTVTRSASLSRMLGGSKASLRQPHLVVPSAAVCGWTALAIPAIGGTQVAVWLLTMAGAVAFAVVQAPAPRPDYTSAVTDMGFGVVQPQVIWSLARGFLLLAVVGALQVAASG